MFEYKVIGVSHAEDGKLTYNAEDFTRNLRNFGVPQNRLGTYIIGLTENDLKPERLSELPTTLPTGREHFIYKNLNEVFEHDVGPKYYLASGCLETLIKYRERQESMGHGFGFRILNKPGLAPP